MSHFSVIKSEIVDIESLQSAVEKMGFKLEENGSCRYFYGTVQTDFVIKLPGKYDIGLTKHNGKYTIKADLYNGEVEKYIGSNGDILLQQYAIEKAKLEGRKRGFSVSEEKLDEKTTEVISRDPAGGALHIFCLKGGEVRIQVEGVSGKNCTKFYEYEEAMGYVEDRQLTAAYYAEDQNPVAAQHYICG